MAHRPGHQGPLEEIQTAPGPRRPAPEQISTQMNLLARIRGAIEGRFTPQQALLSHLLNTRDPKAPVDFDERLAQAFTKLGTTNAEASPTQAIQAAAMQLNLPIGPEDAILPGAGILKRATRGARALDTKRFNRLMKDTVHRSTSDTTDDILEIVRKDRNTVFEVGRDPRGVSLNSAGGTLIPADKAKLGKIDIEIPDATFRNEVTERVAANTETVRMHDPEFLKREFGFKSQGDIGAHEFAHGVSMPVVNDYIAGGTKQSSLVGAFNTLPLNTQRIVNNIGNNFNRTSEAMVRVLDKANELGPKIRAGTDLTLSEVKVATVARQIIDESARKRGMVLSKRTRAPIMFRGKPVTQPLPPPPTLNPSTPLRRKQGLTRKQEKTIKEILQQETNQAVDAFLKESK